MLHAALAATLGVLLAQVVSRFRVRADRRAFEAEMKAKYPPDGVVPRPDPPLPEIRPEPLHPIVVLTPIQPDLPPIKSHPANIIHMDRCGTGSIAFIVGQTLFGITAAPYHVRETPEQILAMIDRLRETGDFSPPPPEAHPTNPSQGG